MSCSGSRGGADLLILASGNWVRNDSAHEVKLPFYCIAQEAFSNVVRHSRAQQAELLILFGEKETRLEMNDNGIGFNMPKSLTDFAPNGHLGLLGIHERAGLIEARLEVEVASGKGTKLKVRM